MTRSTVEVSVIIPVYNRGLFLGDTLYSCFVQSCRRFEVIVVDDGSEEDIRKVVSEFEARLRTGLKLKYLRIEHAGANVARNVGLAAAQGSFVQFLDSDDLIHPEKLEIQLTILTRDPSLDMVYCLSQYFSVTPGDRGVIWNLPNSAQDIDRFLWEDAPWDISSPLWRKKTLERLDPWDESLVCWQDWDFHVKAIAAGVSYQSVPMVLEFIRDHGEPRSTNLESITRRELSKARSARNVWETLSLRGMMTPDRSDAISFFFFTMAVNLAHFGEAKFAETLLRESYDYAGTKRQKILLWLALLVLESASLKVFERMRKPYVWISRAIGVDRTHSSQWKKNSRKASQVPQALLEHFNLKDIVQS